MAELVETVLLFDELATGDALLALITRDTGALGVPGEPSPAMAGE